MTAHKPHSHLSLSTSKDHSQGPSAPRALALQARAAIGGQDWAQAQAASKESPRGRTSLGIVAPFWTQCLQKHSLFGRQQAKWQLFDLFAKSRKVLLRIYQSFLLPSYSIKSKNRKWFEWTCLRWASLACERVSEWIIATEVRTKEQNNDILTQHVSKSAQSRTLSTMAPVPAGGPSLKCSEVPIRFSRPLL